MHLARTIRWALFVLPAVGLTGLFVLYPALGSFSDALFQWAGYGPKRYVGLQNFTALASDSIAWGAAEHSLALALMTAVPEVTIGTAIALALDRRVLGHRTFKLLIFLPWILPSTFIALVWADGYDPFFGWVGDITAAVGVRHAWLNDPHTVLCAIALAPVLQSTGFAMIVVMGALGDVSLEVQEAATLDGVSELQRARHVSVPLVRDAIATVALLLFIWGFTNFDFVYIMTNGGPGTASDVTSTFVYQEAWVKGKFGYACAAAVATTVLVAGFSMIYMTLTKAPAIRKAG